MIGTETLAQTITAITWSDRENVDQEIALDSLGDVPEGWEYIASGGFRHCFRGPDGNVYKVPTAYARKYAPTENRENHALGCVLATVAHTEGVRVARGHYFESCDVMVQEWVEGESPDGYSVRFYNFTDKIARLWKVLGFSIDVSERNFVIVDNAPVLIDW